MEQAERWWSKYGKLAVERTGRDGAITNFCFICSGQKSFHEHKYLKGFRILHDYIACNSGIVLGLKEASGAYPLA